MKKADVQIGETYIVKVSGVLTRVRLDRESQYGGWDGTNLSTGRSVRVRTAARLRRAVAAVVALVMTMLTAVACGGIVSGTPDDADVDSDFETSDDDDAGLSCEDESCDAYCTLLGFDSGACEGTSCSCVTADADVGSDADADADSDAPDVIEDSPETESDDAIDVADVDGGCPSDCVAMCIENGYDTGACEGTSCHCWNDAADADADADPDDAGDTGDGDVTEETEVEEDSGDVTDETDIEEDGATRTCLEPPEGGHADFETGSLLPFETDSDCDPGETVPRADRTHAHGGDMAALLFAPSSGGFGCGLQQIFYPLTGTRTSLWVLIPSAEWWNECSSYPCAEAELASGPLVLGVLFRRDGGIQVGGFTAISTWIADTWNLVERDYTCVGATGYRVVIRVNGIVGRDTTISDAGVVCPPPALSTVVSVSATRFWIDDYCVEAL